VSEPVQLSLHAELTAADGQTFGEWVESLPTAPEPGQVRPKLTHEQRLYLKLEVDRRRREQLATRRKARINLFREGSA
jgi:hypothetical protein